MASASSRNCFSAASRLVISCWSFWLTRAKPGSDMAFGATRMSASTVPHESTAVKNLTSPDKRYHGCQKMVASIKCPVPHSRINPTKSQKIGRKGISLRRNANIASTIGIAA